MNGDLADLLKLLGDDNELLAETAMTEIVNSREPSLDETLVSLRNTGSLRFRHRIRTIQDVLAARRGRERITSSLASGQLSLTDTLLYWHLQWYDKDTFDEVSSQWNDFLEDAGKVSPPDSFQACLQYMDEQQFMSFGPLTDPLADMVCIGAVLDRLQGTDFMLCIMARLLGEHWNFPSDIISSGVSFAVRSTDGVYIPDGVWKRRLSPLPEMVHVWTTQELSALIGRTLFLNAIGSNGFRYLRNAGMARMGRAGLDFLPYPYGQEPFSGF